MTDYDRPLAEDMVPASDPYIIPSTPQIIPVTPEMASSWLSFRNHPKNRPLSKSVAGRYQGDMEAGRWREATPEGLIFDTEGYILSGQHRLKALANARVELRFWIFPGEPREIFEHIDQGFRRTPAHLLRVPYASSLAAGARHLAALADGDRWGMPRFSKITTPEVVETFKAWPELNWHGAEVCAAWRGSGVPQAPHAAVLAQVERTAYRDEIPGWLEGVRTGYDLSPGDSRAHLRNRFRMGLQSETQLPKRDYIYAVIVKAWNAYVNGVPLTLLTHRVNEPLPVVEGFNFEKIEKGAA